MKRVLGVLAVTVALLAACSTTSNSNNGPAEDLTLEFTQHCDPISAGFEGVKVEDGDGVTTQTISIIDTRTSELIDVIVTIDGISVTLEAADPSLNLVDASWCIKAANLASNGAGSENISTPHTLSKGKGKIITPDVSYFMLYSVTTQAPEPPKECQGETAWGGNTEGSGTAWWFIFDTQGLATQTIYAGQKATDGTISWDFATNLLTINLGSWELQDDDESVKIESYTDDTLPNVRPPAGQFTLYKGTNVTIPGDSSRYYAIHLDVELCK